MMLVQSLAVDPGLVWLACSANQAIGYVVLGNLSGAFIQVRLSHLRASWHICAGWHDKACMYVSWHDGLQVGSVLRGAGQPVGGLHTGETGVTGVRCVTV